MNKYAFARHANINWQMRFSLQKVFAGLKVFEIVRVPLGDWSLNLWLIVRRDGRFKRKWFKFALRFIDCLSKGLRHANLKTH